MKLRLWSPRLFLRAVRALERLATAQENHLNAILRIHKLPSAAPVQIEADPDSDDDYSVSYTNEHDTWDRQQRAKLRASAGWKIDDDLDLPPRG
jgi:hypothetical protein